MKVQLPAFANRCREATGRVRVLRLQGHDHGDALTRRPFIAPSLVIH